MSHYEIRVETLPVTSTLYMRFRASPDQLGARLAQVLPAVYGHATGGGGTPAGAPYTRYHDTEGETLELEAGLPVVGPGTGKGEIQAGELPGGPAAVTWHVGPYERLAEAHQALTAWAEKNGYTPAGPAWESYVTDPGAEPDPSKWRTQVVLPLRG